MNTKLVYLVQTDTTVGFASQDDVKLAKIKQRSDEKKFLLTFSSLKSGTKDSRVPAFAKNIVRRSKKTTFVYNDSIARRVATDCEYHEFLNRFDWMYSTSANLSGAEYSKEWASEACDVVVYTPDGFKNSSASSILKLYKTKIKKLR